MTPFERYVGMLKGEVVDFVPRTPILIQFEPHTAKCDDTNHFICFAKTTIFHFGLID